MAYVKQTTFSWFNETIGNLGLEFHSIIETKHLVPSPMFFIFKMLVAELRSNKYMSNNEINRKEHLIKKLQGT